MLKMYVVKSFIKSYIIKLLLNRGFDVTPDFAIENSELKLDDVIDIYARHRRFEKRMFIQILPRKSPREIKRLNQIYEDSNLIIVTLDSFEKEIKHIEEGLTKILKAKG